MQGQPAAVLLTGAPGIGKTELGLQLAAAMLCEAGAGLRPACGQCPACHWFSQGNHPDFRLLTPVQDEGKTKGESAYEIKIGQIREIADFVTTGAHRAGRRIVLLDPADVMNGITANALLKTLEEPTANMHFLLVSSQPRRLPATVRSRCLQFQMTAPTTTETLSWLAAQSTLPEAQLRTALSAAGGSPRLAKSLLEPGAKAAVEAVLAHISSLPEAGVLAVADRLTPIDPRLWLDLLRRWTVDLALVASGGAARSFGEHGARLNQLGRLTNLTRLSAISLRLDRQSALLSRPLNARLLCESILFDYLGAFKH